MFVEAFIVPALSVVALQGVALAIIARKPGRGL